MSHAQWYQTVGQWEEYYAGIDEWIADYNREEEAMKVSQMMSRKFLTKDDCDPPILVTIKSIERVNVAKEGAEEEFRYAMHFDETDKPLVLNSTNIQLCQLICNGSDDTDDWIGHKIVLYNDPNVSFAGKITGGIRVRKPKKAVQEAIEASKAHLRKPDPVKQALEDEFGDIPF
jgi:hypothetical protein